MELMICEKCGSNELLEKDGYYICAYCGAKYKRELKNESQIDLGSDISRLLQRCKSDPQNARKYANLVLDLDPHNKEALEYINPPKKGRRLWR